MRFQRLLSCTALACLTVAGTAAAQTGSRAHPGSPSTAHALPAAVAAAAVPQTNSLAEGFDDINALAGAGWFIQNNSTPVGALGWFQGAATTATPTPGPFNSHSGAANSYIAANFNSTGSTGTISNWLVTPELTFGRDASLTFWTRKPTVNAGQTDYPDRLEVRLSSNGASSNVGTGAAGTGDFTTILLSINPNLVVGGYPYTWTQYTINNASGIPRNGSGRIAFRYFVTGAGSLGTSSDYIGIDTLAYTAGPAQYPVGGQVAGLAGSGLTLSLNGGTPIAITVNGSFQFPSFVDVGASYAVTVAAQPGSPSQTCTVSNGSGTIAGAVTNVQVDCVNNTFPVGGTVTGLTGTNLRLSLNGTEELVRDSNGGFTFLTEVTSGQPYAVTVSGQPDGVPSQTCTVANGSGTIAGAVTDVAVACATDPFTVTATQGNGQVADFDTLFGQLLGARVDDGRGAPVPGVSVLFTAPASGPSATLDDGVQPPSASIAVMTDSNGVALVSATAGNEQGSYSVTASQSNAPADASFTLRNVNPEPEVFEDGFEPLPPRALSITPDIR